MKSSPSSRPGQRVTRRTMSTCVVLSSLALAAGHVAVPSAIATPACDNVVISEAYGGGGSQPETQMNQ